MPLGSLYYLDVYGYDEEMSIVKKFQLISLIFSLRFIYTADFAAVGVLAEHSAIN